MLLTLLIMISPCLFEMRFLCRRPHKITQGVYVRVQQQQQQQQQQQENNNNNNNNNSQHGHFCQSSDNMKNSHTAVAADLKSSLSNVGRHRRISNSRYNARHPHDLAAAAATTTVRPLSNRKASDAVARQTMGVKQHPTQKHAPQQDIHALLFLARATASPSSTERQRLAKSLHRIKRRLLLERVTGGESSEIGQ